MEFVEVKGFSGSSTVWKYCARANYAAEVDEHGHTVDHVRVPDGVLVNECIEFRIKERGGRICQANQEY